MGTMGTMFGKSATRTVEVLNRAGIHARPSLAIVKTVGQFQSKVTIRRDGEVVDAGDILQIMAMAATQGTELELTACGPDAEEVLDALGNLFATCFGLPQD